jgi:hypothetical protein
MMFGDLHLGQELGGGHSMILFTGRGLARPLGLLREMRFN